MVASEQAYYMADHQCSRFQLLYEGRYRLLQLAGSKPDRLHIECPVSDSGKDG